MTCPYSANVFAVCVRIALSLKVSTSALDVWLPEVAFNAATVIKPAVPTAASPAVEIAPLANVPSNMFTLRELSPPSPIVNGSPVDRAGIRVTSVLSKSKSSSALLFLF